MFRRLIACHAHWKKTPSRLLLVTRKVFSLSSFWGINSNFLHSHKCGRSINTFQKLTGDALLGLVFFWRKALRRATCWVCWADPSQMLLFLSQPQGELGAKRAFVFDPLWIFSDLSFKQYLCVVSKLASSWTPHNPPKKQKKWPPKNQAGTLVWCGPVPFTYVRAEKFRPRLSMRPWSDWGRHIHVAPHPVDWIPQRWHLLRYLGRHRWV